MKHKLPYDHVYPIAVAVLELVRMNSERAEIAGSLRRKAQEVGDIEIVAAPKFYVPDMLGAPSETHSLDQFDWSTLGRVMLNGHKQKKIILPGEIQLDLFIVTPPAQWGVIFLLRTGSDSFNKRFVTKKSFGGLMPGHLQMKDGAIWQGSKLLPTPEEADMWKLWEMRPIPPWERK